METDFLNTSTEKNKCIVIAEAGVNHNGSLDIALELCDMVKESGADYIKFQTWKTENIITKSVKQADYQIANTGKNESQFDMLKRLELSYDCFEKIKQYCETIKLGFCSTADDFESLDFLVKIGIPFIKVGSGDICNIPFLRYIGKKNLPILLSTGMSNLNDIKESIQALNYYGQRNIVLLHCTTSYPCAPKDVNLKAMVTLQQKFNYPIGFSDHTIDNDAAIAAVALGATVIEKHVTLSKEMEGPDHIASIEGRELKQLVKSIRNIEIECGEDEKKITHVESEIAEVVKKRIVAKQNIGIGEIFSEDNITVKRNDSGLVAKEWDFVVGQMAKKNYSVDQPIEI